MELKNTKNNMHVKIKSLPYVQMGVAKFISLFNKERALRHLEWVVDDWVKNPDKYMKVTYGSKRKGERHGQSNHH